MSMRKIDAEGGRDESRSAIALCFLSFWYARKNVAYIEILGRGNL